MAAYAVRDVERRITRAWARQAAQDRAHERVESGTATLTEYRLTLGKDVAQRRSLILPTVTVVRAVRQAGVRPAAPALPCFTAARDVLSYLPDEELPEALIDKVQSMSALLRTPASEPGDRAEAAIALILLGASGGLKARHRLWTSGLLQDEAERVWADYEKWHIRELVEDWEPWIQHARRDGIEQGHFQPEEAAGLKLMVPLAGIVAFAKDGGFTSCSGQDRPESAT